MRDGTLWMFPKGMTSGVSQASNTTRFGAAGNLEALRDRLPLRPSEYWRRNCAVTATFISRAEAELRHEISLPNLLWGSDYPHPEGTWPYTERCLRHAFSGLPGAEVADILGGNALALYEFDAEALRPLADRVGPRLEDLSKPPGERPADYLGMGMR